jgi:molybdopterin converting factor small subunit
MMRHEGVEKMGASPEHNVTVRVKALGWTRVFTGASESKVSFSGGALSDFFRTIEERNAGGSVDRSLFLVLVNGRSVCSESYQLSNGDTITLLPVVGGG